MIAVYRTIFGTPVVSVAQSGPISCPRAPPSGFARLASAVAETRPWSLNHKLLYLVGADRTKGWAKPLL